MTDSLVRGDDGLNESLGIWEEPGSLVKGHEKRSALRRVWTDPSPYTQQAAHNSTGLFVPGYARNHVYNYYLSAFF